MRGANKGKAGGATGFTSPALANIVLAATGTTAAAATTSADGERRVSLQSTDPPSSLLPSYRTAPSKDDTSGFQSPREKSGASATSETEGDGRERPKPLEPSAPSLAARSPDEEGVRRVASPKSEASSNNSGGGGGGGGRIFCGRTEDAVVDAALGSKPPLHNTGEDDVVVEKATAPQPRRPSGAKPSRGTSEGRSSRSRSHKLTAGGESGSHRPPSTTLDSTGKSSQLVVTEEGGTAAGSAVVPDEAPSTTAVADTSQDSVGRSDPRGRGVSDRSLDGVGPRGDGVDDDDDLGRGDKFLSPVGGSELGEAKFSVEDYASDMFESVGELSLTQ